MLGDPRANCTYGNIRLDEEDIDLDNALNFRSTQRESERLLRYVVDLSRRGSTTPSADRYTDTLLVRGSRSRARVGGRSSACRSKRRRTR